MEIHIFIFINFKVKIILNRERQINIPNGTKVHPKVLIKKKQKKFHYSDDLSSFCLDLKVKFKVNTTRLSRGRENDSDSKQEIETKSE